MRRLSPELLFTLFWLIAGALSLMFIGDLVAKPKVLFGRSLTAIAPSLFPTIALAALTALTALLTWKVARAPSGAGAGMAGAEWARGALFFGIMLIYALTMAPFGFLISTAIAVTLMSLLTGNRTVWQIALLAILGPVLLYLAATRLLAVSLPELNAIELFYAGILDGRGAEATPEVPAPLAPDTAPQGIDP